MHAISNKKVQPKWLKKINLSSVLLTMLWILSLFVVARSTQHKYELKLEAAIEQYKMEQSAATMQSIQEDPAVVQAKRERELLAKLLYGIRHNSSDDMRTYCWCVFNRVDTDDPLFADTFEEVVLQKGQWMDFSEDNPVVKEYYKIASDMLDLWHSDEPRPCTSDYKYMYWTPEKITLRTSLEQKGDMDTWRWKS